MVILLQQLRQPKTEKTPSLVFLKEKKKIVETQVNKMLPYSFWEKKTVLNSSKINRIRRENGKLADSIPVTFY